MKNRSIIITGLSLSIRHNGDGADRLYKALQLTSDISSQVLIILSGGANFLGYLTFAQILTGEIIR